MTNRKLHKNVLSIGTKVDDLEWLWSAKFKPRNFAWFRLCRWQQRLNAVLSATKL